MGGGILYSYSDVQATVDFKFPASHFVTPAAPWLQNTSLAYWGGTTGAGAPTPAHNSAFTLGEATTNLTFGSASVSYASPFQIIEDVRSWKRIVQIHGRVPAKEVFATTVTMAALMEAWVHAGAGSTVNIPATGVRRGEGRSTTARSPEEFMPD
jgi:hypothetical protein